VIRSPEHVHQLPRRTAPTAPPQPTARPHLLTPTATPLLPAASRSRPPGNERRRAATSDDEQLLPVALLDQGIDHILQLLELIERECKPALRWDYLARLLREDERPEVRERRVLPLPEEDADLDVPRTLDLPTTRSAVAGLMPALPRLLRPSQRERRGDAERPRRRASPFPSISRPSSWGRRLLTDRSSSRSPESSFIQRRPADAAVSPARAPCIEPTSVVRCRWPQTDVHGTGRPGSVVGDGDRDRDGLSGGGVLVAHARCDRDLVGQLVADCAGDRLAAVHVDRAHRATVAAGRGDARVGRHARLQGMRACSSGRTIPPTLDALPWERTLLGCVHSRDGSVSIRNGHLPVH
jgi:hypothetical protein